MPARPPKLEQNKVLVSVVHFHIFYIAILRVFDKYI